MSPQIAFIGMPGPVELIIIAVIVVLLFGKRVPEVMRSLGSGITQFKRGLKEVEELPDEIKKAGKEDAKD